MNFNSLKPTLSDPYLEGKEQQWFLSKDAKSYYFWVQQVSPDVELHPTFDIDCVDLTHDVELTVYRGLAKQEILYRLTFKGENPLRFMMRPTKEPHSIFWTYGKEGGPSKLIKPLFRDKYISAHTWLDKDSFLAVIRTNHYSQNDCSFWSR